MRLAAQVIGAGPAASHPSSVQCYVGRAAEDLDFSSLDGVVPAQVADLVVNDQGEGYLNMVRERPHRRTARRTALGTALGTAFSRHCAQHCAQHCAWHYSCPSPVRSR